MTPSKYQFRIDYRGKGFFGPSSLDEGVKWPQETLDDPWLACAFALDRAKKSDFRYMPALLDLYGRTGDVNVDHMCSALLAVAGTASCFARIVEIVKKEPDFSNVFGFCGALTIRGELSYIPVLLEKYYSNEANPDAAVLQGYIGDLLGDAQYSLDMEDYENEVMRCYQQMVEELGSDQALVFRGERYSVVRLAKFIIQELKSPYFRVRWKADFEAATGINCTAWHQGDKLQPLAAAAVVEEFLESPDAAKYEDGVRYFFGHRIPD